MQITNWFYYLGVPAILTSDKVIVVTIALPLHRKALRLQQNAFSINGFCYISKNSFLD